eukprot:m.76241 g.76241  ORF g.76241 m.76241 type:complete len:84 (+) comp12482_c0_seq4:1304-1555(+)
MSLFKSVQQDNAAGLSWTKSPHFSHLAQSFGTMLQASGADFLASIDWKSLGTAPAPTIAEDDEEEDTFDWNQLVDNPPRHPST